MSSVNRSIQIGRFVKDPEMTYTKSEKARLTFTLAVDGYKEHTDFLPYCAWEKTAELIAKYCKKGDQVCVDGRLTQRSYENSDGNKRSIIEVVVDQVQFLGGKKKQDTPQEATPDNPFSDDDAPF